MKAGSEMMPPILQDLAVAISKTCKVENFVGIVNG